MTSSIDLGSVEWSFISMTMTGSGNIVNFPTIGQINVGKVFVLDKNT